MNELSLELRLVLVIAVLIAGVFDIRFRKIPNWLCATGVLAGLTLNTVRHGLAGLGFALAGMALGFGVYFLLYLIRAMGAGDAKLMAAVGALVGPWNWFLVFLVTSILGGVFAIILMLLTGRVRKTLYNVAYLFKELLSFRAPYLSREELDVTSGKAASLPHGAVIALACLGLLAVQKILLVQ